MKNVLLSLLDGAFSAFLAFIIAFLVLNYFVERPFSIVFSICIALPIFIIAYQKLEKSSRLRGERNARKKIVQKTISALSLMDKSEQVKLFFKAIKIKGYDCQIKKSGIFIESKKVGIFPLFSFDKITKTDVVRAFNMVNRAQKAVVLGGEISQDVKDFIFRFNGQVLFFGEQEVFTFLSEARCLPQEKIDLTKKSALASGIINALFKRKNSTKYLIFGALFLLLSYFSPIKIYYVIWGGVFLLVALLSRLFGQQTATA